MRDCQDLWERFDDRRGEDATSLLDKAEALVQFGKTVDGDLS